MDWEKAKIDYITNPQESYQSIAVRYGVSRTQVGNRAKAEGWRELRGKHLENICTKTADAIAAKRAEREAKLQGAADKLLDKLTDAIDGLDGKALARNAKLPKGLTGALRDIKELLELRPEADAREQEARIQRLRKEIDRDDVDNSVTLTIDGGGDPGWAE